MMPTAGEIFTLPMYSYPDKRAFTNIGPIQMKALLPSFDESNNHIEISVPYAHGRHGYQDSFVITGKDTGNVGQYLSALRAQAEQLGLGAVLWESLHYTGAPLFLNMAQLEKLFEIAPDVLGFKHWKGFISVGASPKDVTEEKLAFLKRKYVNRLKISLFSCLQRELDDLKRPHTSEEGESAMGLARDAEFDILAVELVYGMPSQTLESFMVSLEKVVIQEVDEILLEPIYYLDGKYLADIAAYEDIRYDLYNFASEYLLHEGYIQLSMRRFVKDHNRRKEIEYGDNVLSLGCGGCSVIGDTMSAQPLSTRPEDSVKAVERYILQKNKGIVDFGFVISKAEQKRRYVIENLIHGGGVDENVYKTMFGGHILLDFPEFNDWSRDYFVERKNGTLSLTSLGMSLSDYLGPLLISVDVYKKIIKWDEKNRPRLSQ